MERAAPAVVAEWQTHDTRDGESMNDRACVGRDDRCSSSPGDPASAMAGATIRCEDDGTLIFVIPQDLFTDLLKADPEFEKRTLALIDARRPKPAAKPTEASKPAESPTPPAGETPPKPAA